MMKISEMPKYEVYKDSGVEWLGDIPASWSLLANKHIFRLKKKQVGKRSSEYDLLSLTLRGVIKRDMENPEGKFPAEFDTYQEVQCGDFIFCLFDVEETPRTVGLSPFNGMITGAYTVFELNDNFDNRFLYYFYMNLDAKKMLKPLYRGLRNTIPKDSFLSFKTFVPPHEQQTRIANYLDKKTALIDEAISIKEKQISLLKERKQIIIQQAVTQGLDPNVPMKDSGVDWIGDIPEHWEVVPLKRLAVLSPSVKVSNRKSKELVTFLAMEKVSTDGFIDQDTLMPICDVSQGFTVFNRGDVIVAKITPCFENGKSAWLNNLQTEFGYGSTEFHVLRCGQRIIGSFLYLIVSSPLFLNAGEAMMTGSAGQKRVPSSFIQNFPTAIPGVAEQEKIVSKVKELFSQIDVVVASTVNQIEKLKEYKTTLINSAVTGKIKITPEMVEQ
ncbi:MULTISPECIES: restriction endonuclease subunit S [Morganellaceae]|uniref:restriction endonuclease subunit S n=1 Tax=Morganellaceae TaxID=1903414 RepID=UPI00234AF0B6|nr:MULTISPECIES: restriction endonuclease subunit S [Morganellaceae]HCB2899228.1 restriction endonuclease subunit S [Proteus mirabilis]HCB2908814.1 restriction endonuclease subunit S [Proteus mirabilis]